MKEVLTEEFRAKVASRLDAVDEELRSIRYSLANKEATHPLQDLILAIQMQVGVTINYLFHLTRREDYRTRIANLESEIFRQQMIRTDKEEEKND